MGYALGRFCRAEAVIERGNVLECYTIQIVRSVTEIRRESSYTFLDQSCYITHFIVVRYDYIY